MTAARTAGAPRPRGRARRAWALPLAAAAAASLSWQVTCFTAAAPRLTPRRGPREGRRDVSQRVFYDSARVTIEEATNVMNQAQALPTDDTPGLFSNQYGFWIGLFTFVITLPGVWSSISRQGQGKWVEKTYCIPGPAEQGLEMRSIAGGVTAYFRSLNYRMEKARKEGNIRFEGDLQGNLSEAALVTTVLGGAFFATGLVLQLALPTGPFGIGADWLFAPMVLSPGAGIYYWQRAFRKDAVECTLETSEDAKQLTLKVLGNKDTVEAMQAGVRFQDVNGSLFMLMEEGMEYQPGMFGSEPSVVYKESDGSAEVAPEILADAQQQPAMPSSPTRRFSRDKASEEKAQPVSAN